jgi:hypothetical protein
LADRFQAMAEDFMAKADEAAEDDGSVPFPHVFKHGGPGGGGLDRN